MAYSGEVVAIATQTDRAKPYPLAVGVGYVCGLVLVNIGLTLTANWLDWTLYTLVRDLRWAAMVLWGILLLSAILASFSTRGREARLPLGHLLDGSPWPRSARRVWMGLLGVAAAAVLLPLIPSSPRGLSLHSGPPGESTGEGPSPRYVTQLAFDGTSDAWSRGRPSVDLAGWVYAPLSGPYHFELTAVGSTLLEVDGVALLGFGDQEAKVRIPWATDPSGARRAAADLVAGFHRIVLSYRPPDDVMYAVLRWTPRYLTKPRPIPGRYLLPDETPSGNPLAGQNEVTPLPRSGSRSSHVS
jgi:hypothetical protein